MAASHQIRVSFHHKRGVERSARIVAFMRRRHPSKTADFVASETGFSVNTVLGWLKGTSVPSGMAILTLIEVYGVDFLAAVMPKKAGWLADAERGEELRRIKAERAALDARAEALSRC